MVLPPSLLNPQHLPLLRLTLKSELCRIPPRVTAYLSGLSLLPSVSPTSHLDTPSFEHIEHCLRLLDSYLLGQWLHDEEDILRKESLNTDHGDDLTGGLLALCVAAEIIITDPKYSHRQKIGRSTLCFMLIN